MLQVPLASFPSIPQVRFTSLFQIFDVDDIEFKRKTPSYTYDTVKQIYKGERLNFAIGTDAFEKIESWYEIDKLKDMLNL